MLHEPMRINKISWCMGAVNSRYNVRSKLRSNIGPAKRMVPKHLLTTLPGLIRLGLVVVFCFASGQAQQTLRWCADPSGGAAYDVLQSQHSSQFISHVINNS